MAQNGLVFRQSAEKLATMWSHTFFASSKMKPGERRKLEGAGKVRGVHQNLAAVGKADVFDRPVEHQSQLRAMTVSRVEARLQVLVAHREQGELLNVLALAILRDVVVQVDVVDVACIADQLGPCAAPPRRRVDTGQHLKVESELL